jgi:hypothetical protein
LNRNHARPLLAFCCLALLAAIISSIGLQSNATDVRVRAGTPAPVASATSPDLLLGGAFTAGPAHVGSQGLSAAWDTSTKRELARSTATGTSGSTSYLPVRGGGVSGQASSTSAAAAHVTPGASATTGHVRNTSGTGHGKGGHLRPAKATATKTATHGKGHPKVEH